jgi:hypothetical protein
MKHLLLSALLFTTSAFADYTLLVPQKPGGGTSLWAQIVAEQLEPFLGEKIIIKHYPGARDIPGFNKWHNEFKDEDKVIMVSHGGNGVSFLQENVDYDYREYESIGLMNLNIIVGKLKDADTNSPTFAAGSGMVPEAYAMAMLICGPKDTVEEYVVCFNEHVTWVPGMSGSERRLAFKRGELNATRENPAAYKKHVESNEEAEVWFHHGILDAVTGLHNDDLNYLGYQFEAIFEDLWGVKPEGDFYDAYKLVKSFRDGLQKALWVHKDNPNMEVLRDALNRMVNDPDAIMTIQSKVGQYEWLVGEDGNKQRDTLMGFINIATLQTLVKFNQEALGLDSVYKENLATQS